MGSVAPCRGAVKMGVSMKFLFVFALCSQILPSQQACPDNCNADDGRMVTVKCVDNSGTGDCTCQTSGDDPANIENDCTAITDHDFTTDTYAAMSPETCGTLCEEANKDPSKQCKYWKFIDGSMVTWDQSKSKSCYLMNDAQCTDRRGDCNQDHGCEVGCIEGADDPSSFTCPAQSDRKEESLANNYLSWICYHFDGTNDEEIDIYNSATAPGGTTCTLTPSCKKYEVNEKSLMYKCAEDSENPGSGKWTSSDGDTTHDEDVIDKDNGNKLKDPTCNADPLPLKEGWKQPGMEVNCVDGFAQWDSDANPNTIPSENHCLMFCDYYHVLTFYSKGESGWYYKYTYDGADETEQELQIAGGDDYVDDVIKCWNEPEM